MGRHQGWIHPLAFKYAEQALHAQSATRAQPGGDRLLRHPDAPFHTGQAHKLAFPMIPNIRDRPSGLGRLDTILEGDLRAQRLNRRVNALSVRQRENAFDRVFRGEVDNHIGPIHASKLLALGN